MTTLTIQNLRKSYKKNVVVKNVSLEISSGQIVGLLGPNGAGKTTTFYMIVGLIAAEHGNILLDKKNLTKTPILNQTVRIKTGCFFCTIFGTHTTFFPTLICDTKSSHFAEFRSDENRNFSKSASNEFFTPKFLNNRLLWPLYAANLFEHF